MPKALSPARERDPRTGRPLSDGRDAVGALTDWELEEELTIAAAAPGRMRTARLTVLRAEKARRQQAA